MSSIVGAASIDTVSPVIELEAIGETEADTTQVFTALIAEDIKLKDATLYHRRAGQQAFSPLPMLPLGDTGYFSATLETNIHDLRPIEYYVQARDEAGNRTVRGYAFNPYSRTLLPARETSPEPETTSQPPVQTQEQSAFFKQRWVQITLGVLTVGALVSLTQRDSGESSTVVPLTFTVQ